jgi:Xaa-Pro aminopeptidase
MNAIANGEAAAPYSTRIATLRSRFAQHRIELLLVSSLPNVHYLTGFSGSAGAVVVTNRTSVLFTDTRYDIQAHQEVRVSEVKIVKGDAFSAAAKWSRRYRERGVGFEGDTVSYAAFQRLREFLPNKRLVAVAGLVESLRMEKDEGEIEQIRRAVDAGSRAFTETLRYVKAGVAELDLAAEIEYRMRSYGAERPAFETIVAFGDHAALPHAKPGTRKLAANECVLMDLGAILGGYAGDMSRTVFFGKPSNKAAQMYRAVLEAQLAGEEAVREGVTSASVDLAARRVLERHGLGQYFTHSTGHGVGREIHESPRIAPKQKMRLPERAVITVEPGVYITGFGGVRIEDVVVVRKRGPEVLTRTPKELIVL